MSGPLSRLLVGVEIRPGMFDATTAAAAEVLASDPGLRGEAMALRPALEATIAPCGDEAVRGLLEPLVLVFGVSDAARREAFWTSYLKALSDLPLHGLTAACEAWCKKRDADFFPKPGPLRDLALAASTGAFRAVAIVRRAEGIRPRPVLREQPSAEDVAKVRTLAAQGLKRVDGSRSGKESGS